MSFSECCEVRIHRGVEKTCPLLKDINLSTHWSTMVGSPGKMNLSLPLWKFSIQPCAWISLHDIITLKSYLDHPYQLLFTGDETIANFCFSNKFLVYLFWRFKRVVKLYFKLFLLYTVIIFFIFFDILLLLVST